MVYIASCFYTHLIITLLLQAFATYCSHIKHHTMIISSIRAHSLWCCNLFKDLLGVSRRTAWKPSAKLWNILNCHAKQMYMDSYHDWTNKEISRYNKVCRYNLQPHVPLERHFHKQLKSMPWSARRPLPRYLWYLCMSVGLTFTASPVRSQYRWHQSGTHDRFNRQLCLLGGFSRARYKSYVRICVTYRMTIIARKAQQI